MNNASRILELLDEKLNGKIELTLYGRAALQLGYADPREEYALSKDIDAVFWIGQAEMLLEKTNFWEAIEKVNEELADQELYISHFFTEDQVVLTKSWISNRIPIKGNWKNLEVFRLGDMDLLLSKLMRDDPIDRQDALFIAKRGKLRKDNIVSALKEASIPDIPEILEQLNLASRKLIKEMEEE